MRIKLAQKQYEVAMSGNVTMLIWLGKQYLSQSEKQELSGSSDNGKPIIKFSFPDPKEGGKDEKE